MVQLFLSRSQGDYSAAAAVVCMVDNFLIDNCGVAENILRGEERNASRRSDIKFSSSL